MTSSMNNIPVVRNSLNMGFPTAKYAIVFVFKDELHNYSIKSCLVIGLTQISDKLSGFALG